MSIRPVLTASSSGPPDENVWSSMLAELHPLVRVQTHVEQLTQHVRTIAPHCRLEQLLSPAASRVRHDAR